MSTVAPAPGVQSYAAKEEQYDSPQIVFKEALLHHWEEEYERSIADNDKFWGEYAHNFRWTKPFHTVSESSGPHHKWFVGGKTNITLNALDRHAKSERRNRVAYIWLCEDGSER